jgi:hypothetical protein
VRSGRAPGQAWPAWINIPSKMGQVAAVRVLAGQSSHPRHPSVLELHMTEVGREALHSARERVDPIERRVFGVFAPKDMAAYREFLSRFIEAFEGE